MRHVVAALLLSGVVGAGLTSPLGAQQAARPDLPPFHPEVARLTPNSGVKAPVPIRRLEPKYTREAMQAKVEGAVWVEALIDHAGEVTDTRVVKSLHPDLDRNAETAAEGWTFEPASKDGAAVPVVVTLVLEFRVH